MSKCESLCFDCKNAVCGCSWSKRFEPVEGWEAIPKKIRIDKTHFIASYVVKKCPLYSDDRGLHYDKTTIIKYFCKANNISRDTFYRWRKKGKIIQEDGVWKIKS